MLAAQAMGEGLAYIGSTFIATVEANAIDGHKQAIGDAAAADIVYSILFTGHHGNYLKRSLENAGLDPENLPGSNLSALNFSSSGNQEKKAWKDIWGCGQ